MARKKLEMLNDLKIIRQELDNVKEKWFDIGMELNQISPAQLRKIAETHKQDYSNCLNLMLIEWLERGEANWKVLCDALRSTTVKEYALSKQLHEKHCTGTKQFENLSGETATHLLKRGSSDDKLPKAKRPRITASLPSGFAPDDFIRAQPPDRICYKCKKIPCIPLRPECCSSKLYCEPCSLKVQNCSIHQHQIKYVRDDNLFKSILKLKLKCPNWRHGCEFKETVSKVHSEHLLQCTRSKNGVKGSAKQAVNSVVAANIKAKLPVPTPHNGMAVFPPQPITQLHTEEIKQSFQSKTSSAPVVNTSWSQMATGTSVSPASHKLKLLPEEQNQHAVVCDYQTNGHGQTHVRVAPVVKPLQVYFSNQSRMDIKKEPSSPVALQRTDKESRINHAHNSKNAQWSALRAATESHIGVRQVFTKKEPMSPGVLSKEKQVHCEYKAIGCNVLVCQGRMKQHLQEYLQHHLDLAIKHIILIEKAAKK